MSKAAERSNKRRTEILSLSRAERISFTIRNVNERRHSHFSSCVCRLEIGGDRCQHWSEEIERKKIEMKDIREISKISVFIDHAIL